MAMPTSGQIKLFDAGKEVVVGAREAPIADATVLSTHFPNGISLTEISTGTGAASNDPINIYSPSYPDGSTPHALSEFYGYIDNTLAPGVRLEWSRASGTSLSTNYLWTDPSHTANTDPAVDPVGTGTNTRWRKSYFNIYKYRGRTIRLVIGFDHYSGSFRNDVGLTSWSIEKTNGSRYIGEFGFPTNYYVSNTTSYAGPIFRFAVDGVDRINLGTDVMQRNSSTSANGYQATTGWTDFPNSTSSFSPYTTPSTIDMETNSSNNGEWNYRIDGATPSGGTGPENVYLYRNGYTEYYEMQNAGYSGDPDWPYLYYEASGQSANSLNGWSWMRTTQIEVPSDALNLHFIYSAYSTDQTNWYNNTLAIYVDLVS